MNQVPEVDADRVREELYEQIVHKLSALPDDKRDSAFNQIDCLIDYLSSEAQATVCPPADDQCET